MTARNYLSGTELSSVLEILGALNTVEIGSVSLGTPLSVVDVNGDPVIDIDYRDGEYVLLGNYE